MTMSYLRVTWIHSLPDEPRLLYSELDERRMERRKIEIYPDGRWGFADEDEEAGRAGLGEVAVPSVAEISADPQFEAFEVEHAEFERLWDARRGACVWAPRPIGNEA